MKGEAFPASSGGGPRSPAPPPKNESAPLGWPQPVAGLSGPLNQFAIKPGSRSALIMGIPKKFDPTRGTACPVQNQLAANTPAAISPRTATPMINPMNTLFISSSFSCKHLICYRCLNPDLNLRALRIVGLEDHAAPYDRSG